MDEKILKSQSGVYGKEHNGKDDNGEIEKILKHECAVHGKSPCKCGKSCCGYNEDFAGEISPFDAQFSDADFEPLVETESYDAQAAFEAGSDNDFSAAGGGYADAEAEFEAQKDKLYTMIPKDSESVADTSKS